MPVPPDAPTVRLGIAAAHRCRRRVHLDHDPDADRSALRPIDDGVQLRLEVLAEHRRKLGDRLFMTLPRPIEFPWTDASPWVSDTGRPPLIWQARLATDHRAGTADLLVLQPDGGYVPVIIRGHRTTDPGRGAELTDVDELAAWGASYPVGIVPTPQRSGVKKPRSHSADASALAHLYRMLGELGVASGRARGGVIGFGGPMRQWDDGAVILWHRLDADNGDGTPLEVYDDAFADRLAVATAAANRWPALAQPSRIGECRRCPWWTVCGPRLAAARDVSLLVPGDDAAMLRGAGAVTYDDVAALPAAELAALPLADTGDLRVRARALSRGLPLVWRDAADSVPRADVELDIDMESYGDDGAYLWGTYLTGAPVDGFEPGYRAFATWQELESSATAANFVEFWHYVAALRGACAAAGLTFAAYCYSRRAEERWLYGTPDRFPHEPGMPGRDEVREFCESTQWVDLYAELKRLFVIPGSMRLKVLAPLAGFAWRDPDPGGANSMAWYRVALGGAGLPSGRVSAAEVAANRARILRYNEDDVLATLRLREWVSAGAGGAPSVAELDALWP